MSIKTLTLASRKLALISLLVLLLLTFATATLDVSFEAAYRTTDSLQRLLTTTQFITAEVQGLFSHGLLGSNDTHAAQRLRTACHAFLHTTTSPHPTSVRVVAQGQFLAISPTHLKLTTQEQFQLNEQPCNLTSNSSADLACVHQFHLASASSPIPSHFQRSMEISLSAQFDNLSPQCTLPCWQPITTTASNSNHNHTPSALPLPSIEHVAQIHNTHNQPVGHVGVGLSLSDLQSVVDQVVGEDSDDRVVLVIDDDTKSIIVVSSTTNSSWCGDVPVLATQCTNARLQWFAVQVAETSNHRDDNQVFTNGEYFGISVPFQAAGLSWHVVVIRYMTISSGAVGFSSVEGISICIFHSFVLMFSLFLLAWVLRFRHLQLWHVAQPWMLILLLLSFVLFAVGSFDHLGHNTRLSCASREWLVTIATTLAGVSLFCKQLRVHMNLNNPHRLHSHRAQVKNRHMLTLATILIGLQILILAFWQVVDPIAPAITYSNSGDVEGIVMCRHTSLQLLTTRLLTFFSSFGAIYLSVKTRNVSQMFAESRFLITISMHGVILYCVLTVPYMLGRGTYSTAIVLSALAEAWFAFAAFVSLFFPRITRQIDQGDLTVDEVKQLMVEHLKHKIKTDHAFAEFSRQLKPAPRALYARQIQSQSQDRSTASTELCVV